MLLVLTLLCAILSASLAQDPSILARLSRFSQLNPSPLYELYWNVTGDRITFAVRVETEGWVGFGISPNGLMLDSDVVMGFVQSDGGLVTFTDRRTNPSIRVMPEIDANQDWNLVSGSQTGGFTTLEFTRLLDTGDTEGDRVIGERVNLIWSLRTDDDTTTAHTTRGAQTQVQLLPPGSTPATAATTATTDPTTSPTDATTPTDTTTDPTTSPTDATTPTDTTTDPTTSPTNATTPTDTTDATTSPPDPTTTPDPTLTPAATDPPNPSGADCNITCDLPRMLNADTCTCDCPPVIEPCPFGQDEFCLCTCPSGAQEECENSTIARFYNAFTCECSCIPIICGENEQFNDDPEICSCVELPSCPEVTNTTCDPPLEFSLRSCSCELPCTITCEGLQVVNFDTCTCQCQPSAIPSSEKCPPPLMFSNDTCFCQCPPELVVDCPPNQFYSNFSCSCQCEDPPTCQLPQQRNDATCMCECPSDLVVDCPTNHIYNDLTCSCECDLTTMCLPMFVFDADTCSCMCNNSFICPDDQRLDTSSCECVCDTTCQSPQAPNDNTCQCECPPDLVVECLPNQVYNDDTCSCGCDSSITCPEGRRLDPTSCECVCDSPDTTCPAGQTYDSMICGCVCDTEQQCCEGQVFDEDSCSCRCESVLNCSTGYVFNTKSCQCVCEGSISEDVWYDRIDECKRDYNKIFSIFSCDCECHKDLKCHGKKVIDPETCRCVCPTSSCTSPKAANPYTCDCQCTNYRGCGYGYHWDEDECKCKCQERACYHGQRFNINTCECERLCPQSNTRCHRHYTFDYDTCQCKCSRRCRDHEVLDSDCRCTRKQEPTTPYTAPPTSSPPLSSDVCSSLSYNKCYHSERNHGVSCRWDGGRCTRVCCKSNRPRERRTTSSYCSWLSQSYCHQSHYCTWEC